MVIFFFKIIQIRSWRESLKARRRRQSTDNQRVTFCRRNFIRSGTSESVIIMAELGQTRLQCSTATEDKMSPL